MSIDTRLNNLGIMLDSTYRPAEDILAILSYEWFNAIDDVSIDPEYKEWIDCLKEAAWELTFNR